MTIPYSSRLAGPFTAVADQVNFGFTWRILSAADLDVWRTRAGVPQLLTYATDWSLAPGSINNAAGGTVVLAVGATAGDIITILGDRTAQRLSAVSDTRAITAADLNGELDAIQLQIQELKRDVAAALHVHPARQGLADTELPAPSGGTAIGWNAAGDGLENKALVGTRWRGAWASGAAYALNDEVTHLGSTWRCTVGHTSAAATEPENGASHLTVWQQATSKGGPGPAGTVAVAADGTEALPGMAWSSDPDTGFRRKASNDMGVSAGGAEVGGFDTQGLRAGTNAGVKARLHKDGFIELPQITAPGVPASGHDRIYMRTDGKIYRKSSDGSERSIGAAGVTTLVITSSTVYSKPSGLVAVRIRCQAPGGGGGGANCTAATHAVSGAGGGGGGYCERTLLAFEIASTESVTIGAVGAGGNSSSSWLGGDGGNVSFGSHCTAYGGDGGGTMTSAATLARSTGGAGGGGVLGGNGFVIDGEQGEDGFRVNVTTYKGGDGGGAVLGFGGRGLGYRVWSGSSGGASGDFGGGGRAGDAGGAIGSSVGHAGGAGCVIIEEFF